MSAGRSTLITRLNALDTGAVSDALDHMKLPAAVTGLQRLSTNRRIAGRVVTVELGTQPPAAGSRRHLCTGAISAAEPGDVIVVQQSTGLDAAGWGGVLSTGAKLGEIAGVIVEGPARDIDEAQQIGFTVYARGATTRTARGRIYEQSFNTTILVGDVSVSAGDFVVADSSGVTFIPQDRAVEVLDTAERIAAKEQHMIADLERGAQITDVMGKSYETMLESSDD